MKKNKILIITNEFIPYTRSLGGVFRMLTLTQLLINKNFDIHILTSKNFNNSFKEYNSILNSIKIHYINDHKLFIKRNNRYNFNLIIFLFRVFRKLFYNFYNSLICFGFDQARPNIKKYISQSQYLINKFDIKNVIISGPPFSLFFVSSYLRYLGKNIKIIHDYRDSWTLRFDSNDILKRISTKFIESKTLNSPDYVTCASQGINKKLLHNFPMLIEKNIVTIFNGYVEYDKKIFQNKKKIKNDFINIGYFGMITDDKKGYRDINIIYKNILNTELESMMKFNFYGPNNIKSKKISNYKNFTFKKTISHDQALKKMFEMDYLLLIHTEKNTAEEVLTTKLFDYIYVGKPIIVISNGVTEAGKLIEMYNIGRSINLITDNFMVKLKNIIQNFKYKKLDDKTLFYFSRNYQNSKFLKLLNE